MPVEHKSLTEARLAVMAEVPYVQKRETKGLNYTYAGEADLIAAMHQSMVKHGIAVAPVAVQHVESDRYQTAKGASMASLVGIFTFRFSHISGDFLDVQVYGEAADSGDKRASKAHTMALKYALRQTFLIETGDDPDDVAHERGKGNSDEYKRAVTAIKGAKDTAKLAKIWEHAITSEDCAFTQAQLATLAEHIEERRTAINGQA